MYFGSQVFTRDVLLLCARAQSSASIDKELTTNIVARDIMRRIIIHSADDDFQFEKRAIFTYVHNKRWSKDAI